MDFLKNRKTAVAVFVAVVIVFSLIGCHISLSRACKQVEDAFFDKSLLQADGYYTCPGDQLDHCVKLANRLMSVIGGEGEWDEAYADLSRTRQALVYALESRDIPRIFEANTLLMDAVAAAQDVKDSGVALPGSNDDFDAIVADFWSAQAVAADPAYNNHVQAFIDGTLRVFPTNILRRLSFVSLPDAYR